MTVLRSREVKSVVEQLSKNNSPNSNNTKQPRVSSIEPKTPSVTRETHLVNAFNSASQMNDRSRSGSVRRSLRLASKNCEGSDDDVKKSEVASKNCEGSNDDVKKSEVVSSVSSRKRKSFSSVSKGIGDDFKLGGAELENVVVEDSMGSDFGGEEGSGEVSEKGGVELENVGVEDSGKGSEEVSEKGKGKRKLGFGIESVGEESGEGLRLRSGKKVAGRGGVRGFGGNVDVLMRGNGGGHDGREGEGVEGNGGRGGGLKLSFDDEMEGGFGKVERVEGLLEVDEGLRDEAVSVDVEGKGRVGGNEKGKGKLEFGIESVGEGEGEGEGGLRLRLRSGKKVAGCGGVRGFGDNVDVLMRDAKGNDDGEKGGVGGDCGAEENGGPGGLKSSFDEEMEVGLGKVETLPEVDEEPKDEAVSIDDEGEGRVSRKDEGKGKAVDMAVETEANKVEVSNGNDDAVKKDGSLDWKSYLSGNNPTAERYRVIMGKINKGSKGDGINNDWEELISKCIEGVKTKLTNTETGSSSHKGKGRARDETVGSSDVGRRRLSRQVKGKEKLAENLVESEAPKVEMSDSGNTAMQDGMPEAPRAERSNSDSVARQDATHVQENDVGDHVSRTRDRFRAQARRSASRFAFFSTAEEEQSHVVDEAEADMAPREMEDWPGPFSTAMKIIKERRNLQQKDSSSGKETPQMTWVPKQEKNHRRSNFSVPLLQELCMITLTKNADAITSLDYVPDVLRHKLSHMLCDMRRMNSHFLELLARGSPSEIRVRDCSWLSEEDFTKIFAGANISNLAVLQLDQCGRCMPDYILYATLGRSPNCLPLLTTLSLKGACRLSDNGLSSLLSSAPSLRSLNLSQCSLLTSGGINSIADSLGSVLKELYLDDCESIDPILILPALSKLEYLEVLSLAGLHTVCDDFICQLIALRGDKLKELVLADCVKLTDISLKVISKSCTGMCALDLTNLCKLTDCALGYLANGCQSIRSLKLRRNSFSDEAVAAYLETSGGSLEELSLNNVSKVAYNTAISLSKCSMNLQILDLSFCRKLSNEAVGLIADGCLSLKTLKLFGCTQITDVFLDGHSNEQVQVIGLQMTPILEHIKVPELVGPLRYSAI